MFLRYIITIPPITYHSGADRDRTGDLLLAKQVLSQLSYGPVVARNPPTPFKLRSR